MLKGDGWGENFPGEAWEVGAPGGQIGGVLLGSHTVDSDTDVVGETTKPKMNDEVVEV